MTTQKAQYGVTIFEMVLVIAIMGMILVMSIAQYYVYARQNEVDRVNANLEILFRAMQNYYQANCIANYNYAGTPFPGSGALDPAATTGLPTNLPINISTQLIGVPPAGGYITQQIIQVPIVDLSDYTNNIGYLGYVAQFNQAITTRQAASQNGNMPVGQVYLWKIQIAVKIRDVNDMDMYKSLLGADCVSDLAAAGGAGSYVIPCSSTSPAPPTDGTYLVWERLPSFAAPSSRTSMWPSAPLLKQFKDQYTHDTFYEMNNNQQIETPAMPGLGQSYYLCGG